MSFSNNSTPVHVIYATSSVTYATSRKRIHLDMTTTVKRPDRTFANLAIQNTLSGYHDRSSESDNLSVDVHVIMGCIRSKLWPFIPMNQSVLSLAEANAIYTHSMHRYNRGVSPLLFDLWKYWRPVSEDERSCYS